MALERTLSILKPDALQSGFIGKVLARLEEAGLKPVAVTITGGTEASQPETDQWRVPKRDLVSVLQVLLQRKRLRFAAGLPEAGTLLRELRAYAGIVTARYPGDARTPPQDVGQELARAAHARQQRDRPRMLAERAEEHGAVDDGRVALEVVQRHVGIGRRGQLRQQPRQRRLEQLRVARRRRQRLDIRRCGRRVGKARPPQRAHELGAIGQRGRLHSRNPVGGVGRGARGGVAPSGPVGGRSPRR